METEAIDFHIPTAFKLGDLVKVVSKVETAYAWHAEWTPGMNGMVGLDKMRVYGVDTLLGFFVGPAKGIGTAWFPSAALEMAAPAGPIVIAVQSAKDLVTRRKRTQEEMSAEFLKQGLQSDGTPPPPATSVELTSTPAKPKAKTRTIKAGPWDAAPCTHLRWHMMGFYNEKLKLTVTKVMTNTGMLAAVTGDGGECDLTFACTKCDKSIVMVAPVNTVEIKK